MDTDTKPVSKLVAWRVEIDSSSCIAFALTKAKAQWVATKSYWEAYGKGQWPRARAWREPRFDLSSLRFQTPRAYTEESVLNSQDLHENPCPSVCISV